MVSNDVTAGEVVDALLLTPKSRLIAPVRVWRRGAEDFLLLTEPELGEVVRTALLRSRFAAKCDIELEEHVSALVFGDGGGPAGRAARDGRGARRPRVEPSLDAEELERARIEAGVPAWGKELDDSILPAEAGLDDTHISFSKGCYPGQEPIARLRHRGHVNRKLRVLEVDAKPGDELVWEGKAVGRVTSAVPGVALGYVRTRGAGGRTAARALTPGGRFEVRPARFELATSASAGQRSIP